MDCCDNSSAPLILGEAKPSILSLSIRKQPTCPTSTLCYLSLSPSIACPLSLSLWSMEIRSAMFFLLLRYNYFDSCSRSSTSTQGTDSSSTTRVIYTQSRPPPRCLALPFYPSPERYAKLACRVLPLFSLLSSTAFSSQPPPPCTQTTPDRGCCAAGTAVDSRIRRRNPTPPPFVSRLHLCLLRPVPPMSLASPRNNPTLQTDFLSVCPPLTRHEIVQLS